MANGGVSGPVSTEAEKAFSQIGLALLTSSTGETVEVGTVLCVAVGTGVTLAVGSGVWVGDKVCAGAAAGAG